MPVRQVEYNGENDARMMTTMWIVSIEIGQNSVFSVRMLWHDVVVEGVSWKPTF